MKGRAAYHRRMGDSQTEQQIAKAAARSALDVLAPRVDAARALALAEHTALAADDVRADADRRVEKIRADAQRREAKVRADAEAEIERRIQEWSKAFQAALAAGWTRAQLIDPLGLRLPPASRKRARRAAADRPGTGTTEAAARVKVTPGAATAASAREANAVA